MKKLLKKTGNMEFSGTDIEKLASEYENLSSHIKSLSERKAEISLLIKDYCAAYGVTDDKGSSYVESGEYVLGRIKKDKSKIDVTKAVGLFMYKGLFECYSLQESYVINEEEVEKCLASGELTYEELDTFMVVPEKPSYSVSVVKAASKEEMPVVEQSAASLKPRRRIK